MSLMKHKNNQGPRTVPCETLEVTGEDSLKQPSRITYWDLAIVCEEVLNPV